jgi:predicted nucleotide-binding protein (sugar kinase/HSP70/actin superfamily)
MEKKGRIGIPKALMFYRYVPFWRTFFESLGWEVIVSKDVGKKGKIIYFEDSCLPMKLLVTHATSLASEVDHLFVPRLVSLHPKYILCPKFRGAPDIVRLAIEKKVSILDETIDLRTRKHSYHNAFSKIGEKLNASTKEIHSAFSKAERSYSFFQNEWVDRINRLPTKDLFRLEVPTLAHSGISSPLVAGDEGEGGETGFYESKGTPLRVAFIGHPYNLFDTDINKDIIGLAKQLGMRILTSELLSEKAIDAGISDLSKEIYWSSGREIVGSLFHFLSGEVDGVVFITSFKCGIDALLQEFVKRVLRIRGGSFVPFLVLSFDEHTGREGLTTRIEAFKDVIEQRKRQAPNNGHPPLSRKAGLLAGRPNPK